MPVPSNVAVANFPMDEQYQLQAMEIYIQEIDRTCRALAISADPFNWSNENVRSWIAWYVQYYGAANFPVQNFVMKGIELCSLDFGEFMRRAHPNITTGEHLFYQLEVWKTAASSSFTSCTGGINNQHGQVEDGLTDLFQQWHGGPAAGIKSEPLDHTSIKMEACMSPSAMSMSSCASPASGMYLPGYERVMGEARVLGSSSRYGSEGAQSDDEVSDDGELSSPGSVSGPSPTTSSRGSGSHIHLWQFLKELLAQPAVFGSSIRWIDFDKGVFKIEDSVKVARLWGKRKNRPAMNYDKLSRSIRQYYKKGIMKKTERSQRLVYQFCNQYIRP